MHRFGRVGLVALAGLILVGGSLFAQWIDVSDESLLREELPVGWATTVVNEDAKLLASEGVWVYLFGSSVAVSGDTAVVGSFIRYGGTGAAYVFVRGGTCGSAWCEEAKLLPGNGAAGDLFGNSVAVSGDTAVVGALSDDENGLYSGSAYVFVRGGTCGSTWCQEAKLLPNDGALGDNFGISVSISGDTAVVGAWADDDNGHTSGSAYVFVRGGACGSAWCQEAKLLPGGGAVTFLFGTTVAVSGDTAVVGEEGFLAGAAYVFARGGTCGSTWCEEAKLGTGSTTDKFGRSVAVSGDTAVVGAKGLDYSHENANGSAYVFVRGGTCGSVWCEEARLLASDGAAQDQFGESVAVNGDTVIAGASHNHDNGAVGGAAYVFVRGATCGSAWCEQAKLVASDGSEFDTFGHSVAVSGHTAVVGAVDDGSTGSAYVFRVPAGDCDPCIRWMNHGEYVRCVSNTVSALVKGGAMTEDEGHALVSSAAMSDVGKEGSIPPPECTP